MIAIIGDIHIVREAIEEINNILQEIFDLCKDQKVKQVWFLGDMLDKNKPHPVEYEFLTKWLVKFQKLGKVEIVSGNHEALSNDLTALHYSVHFGVTIHNTKVVKLLGNKKIYLGHHATDQADEFKIDENYKLKDLKKYDLVFLGHLHNFHKLAKNIYHLGAVRRCTFGEIDYPEPRIAFIRPKSLKIDFYEIKNYFPMKDVFSIKEAKSAPKSAKIRLVFKSFEDFISNIDEIPKIQGQFTKFTVKHDYEKKTQVVKKKQVRKKSFEQIFQDYLKTVENKEVRTILKEMWK